MQHLKKYLPYLLVGGAIAAFYFWRYRTVPSMEFSEVQLKNDLGEIVTLKNELADSSVIHFYATWCGPCMKELREFNASYHLYENSGIKFIFITDDKIEQIRAIQDRMPQQIKFYHIDNMQDLGIYSIPTSYFVHQGSIQHKQVDQVNWSDKINIDKYFSK